ncbi:hypothetical protein [Bacillus sp. EAC]|uniref:hypothetical protein n=1 Tax=Bacillus sp. EAC TaxID=1978338 RepID=UPI000B43BEA1|nr:hypothetical protein [Bacillus sp. EAC]
MSEKNENLLEEVSKSLLIGLTFGSSFDPDMSEEKVKETREFSTIEVFNHLTRKEKLADSDIEALKRSAKYNRSL